MNLNGFNMNDTDMSDFFISYHSFCQKIINSGVECIPPLKDIPVGILSLFQESLVLLSLHGNSLTHLPNDICQLQHLTQLRLDDSNLEELPSHLGHCHSLEVLHLTNNQRLKYLSESIGELSHLHHILLDGTAVGALPPSMSKCLSLEFVVADEQVLVEPPFHVWSEMDGAAFREYLNIQFLCSQDPYLSDRLHSKTIAIDFYILRIIQNGMCKLVFQAWGKH